jgi:O-antigen/teichoic acid export membrane protein
VRSYPGRRYTDAIRRRGAESAGWRATTGPTGLTILVSFASQALLVVSGIAVARMLGVEDRGNLALLVLISYVLVHAGGLGLPTATTYYLANREYDSLRVLEAVRAPAVALTAGLIPIQLLLIFLLFRGNAPVAAGISLLATPGTFAFVYGLALLQGLREFRRFNLVRLLPGGVYAASMLALLLTERGNLVTVTSAWAVGLLATGLIVLVVGTQALLARDPGHGRRVSARNLLSFGLKGLLGSTYPIDTFQLDQAAIGVFMSPATLGLYVVAVAFTNLPRFIGMSIGIVAYPTIADSPDPSEGQRQLKRFALLAAVVSLVIVATLEISAGWLVPFLFGSEFEGAVPLVRILIVAASLTAVRRVLTEGARGRGEPGIGSIAELIAWVVLLPALAVFGALWGANGVAFAMVVSSVAGLAAVAIGVTGPKKEDRRLVSQHPAAEA